jgi:hypothetical protein
LSAVANLRKCVAFAVFAGLQAGAEVPVPEFWAGKPGDAAALDRAAQTLPAAVRPAVDFEKVLFQVRQGAPVESWRRSMQSYAEYTGGDPVRRGLTELARCWLARAQVAAIDVALRGYYRKHVRFPAQLADVMESVPENARHDPWGEAWVYAPATTGFSKKAAQRYRLGPTRYPQLSTQSEAARRQGPQVSGLKAALRDVGGMRALELRSADGRSAVIQPGGRFGEIGLLYLADSWALLADTERLFTLSLTP